MQLEQIIAEEDEEDRGFITAKDFMNDFATEEFLNKNIRVRPLSGVSRGQQDDGKTHDNQQSKVGGAFEVGDEDEKFNQMKIIEMLEEREKIKQTLDDYKRKKKAEEDKLAKKRR